MVAQYLEANYDRFFAMSNALIMSNNYVTKRQSLKMLGEILLDRSNYNIMTRYISNEGNLKTMMNFLRDKSRNIQYEAFHVFKVSQVDGFISGRSRAQTSRCLLQTQTSHRRSWLFSAGTRTSSWHSSRISIMTRMVRHSLVLIHCWVG